MSKDIIFWRLLCLIPLFSLLANQEAKATHLVGGDLGYEYLGETNPGSGIYSYRVYMNFYLNCDNSSSFESFYDLLQQNYGTPLPLGIYLEDPSNPGSDKVQLQELELFLTDTTVIEPALPMGCGIGQGLCAVKGEFEAIVNLPLNFGGYHLYFQMCCRNLSITNLANPNGSGIGYYAYIPPPLVNNSSPVFLGLPTPFLCVNDTSTFLNSAVDPDGDQLVFSFETPYDSYQVQGGIINPPSPLNWTVPTVNYAATFSSAQPFGPGGYSFINAVNGLTEYSSPMAGNFIIAVEVKEYRNGFLIGITRRDLQLQVIACPPNTTPALDATTVQIAYSVDAGDQLCFNSEFNDLDGDSLFLSAAGAIFDPALFNPAATILAPDSGAGSVSTQFCWNTACDQGQTQPYLFSLSVRDNGCPPKTVDVVYEITVNSFVGPASIVGPATVCEAATATQYSTQDVGNGASYQWFVNGGSINGSSTDTLITVDWGSSTSGVVSLVATSQFGCEADTLFLPVTINTLPAADAGGDITICEGQTIAIGGSPTGPAGSTYAWTPSATLSSPVVANPDASPSTDQQYIVSVTSNGCSLTDTVNVFVSVVNADAGGDATICVGDSVQLTGSGGLTYNWTPNSNIINANTASPTVFPTSTTTYYMDIVDANSCSGVDSVVVTVNSLPVVDAGPDSTICAGEALALGGSPTGPTGSIFTWDNAGSLDNANSANPLATPSSSTTYTVLVVDANQCSNSDDVVITLNPQPAINAGADVSICPGDSAQLNASLASNYIWTPTGSLSDPNISDPWASPTSTTTYTVTTSDANACSNSDDITVTVLAPPAADAGSDVGLCIGDTIQLNASGGGSYAWSPGTDLSTTNIAAPLAWPTVTQVYTVTVTDANNCVASDDVTVTVNALPVVDAGADISICAGDATAIGGSPTGPAGSNYSWTPAAGLDNASNANPNASPTTSTIYTVAVIDNNNCTNSDQVSVSVNPLPALFAGNDTAVCINSSIQLNATGTGSFSWSPSTALNDATIANPIASPTTTITYTVSLTDGNNCTSTDDIVVDVLPLPSAEAGIDVWLCPGFSTQLQASGGSNYSWSPTTALSDPLIANPDASPTVSTMYYVTVFDAAGCSDTDSVLVTVNDDVPVDAGADTTLCVGDSVMLGGFPTSISGTTYDWQPAGTLNDNTLANPLAFPSTTTTYVLTVSNDTCTNVDQVVVTIQGGALADFTVEFEPRCDGLRAWFFNQSQGGSEFLWDFGGGNTSTSEDPSVVFPNGQAIVVTLLVTDAQGCTSSITQSYSTYNFLDFMNIEMPNVFTPNGDNDNDVFEPNSNTILGPCANLHVFNRWGSRVFTSTGGNVSWGGFTFAGEPAVPGTYFYVLEIEGLEFKGTVTLMR